MKYLFYLRPTTSGQSNNFRTTQRFLEHETSEQPKDLWTIKQLRNNPNISGTLNNFGTAQKLVEHQITSEQPKDFWTIQQILTILQRCLYPPRIHPLGRLYSLFISNAFVIVIE